MKARVAAPLQKEGPFPMDALEEIKAYPGNK